MSKLLKLKAWLTLDEAARHLSTVFGEEVERADILRLALDGRLTLAVHLVNGAMARCGPLVPGAEADYTEFPIDLKSAMSAESPEEYKGGYMKVPKGVRLNTGDVIQLGEDVVSLRGIYELPMIGGERLDIEHEYQMLTGGPGVTLQGLDGSFVLAGDGSYCQLQESFDQNEYQAGSTAAREQLERMILEKKLDKDAANKLREKHRVDRDRFMKERSERHARKNYYPAGGLPKDAVLVVMTSALTELQAELGAEEQPSRKTGDIGKRERDTLLKLVIGMAIGAYKYSPGAARSNVPAEIVSDLLSHGIEITDDTVRKWLKEAAVTVLPQQASER